MKPNNNSQTLPLLIITGVALVIAPLTRAQHAFIWDSTNGMQAIGSLGGGSYATGINDSGQVAGYSYLADNTTLHAFIWTSATGMTDLGTPGGAFSLAEGINSSGHVVGFGQDADGDQIAFFWSPETGFVNVGGTHCACAGNYGAGINNRDEVTGQYQSSTTSGTFGFIWSPTLHTRDIGVLSDGTYSGGEAINNRH